MNRTLLAGFIGIELITSAGSAARSAQDAPPGLTLVDVAVEESSGSLVSGLTRDDFEVLVDGQTRPIEFFTEGSRPLTVVLLLDVSVSVTDMFERGALRKAIETSFIPGLQPADRARIAAFGKHRFMSRAFTADRRELLAATRAALDPREADRYGPSPVWDAVGGAVSVLKGASGRRAILLLTDGHSTGNLRGVNSVGEEAVAAGVLVSVVGEDEEVVIPQEGTIAARVRAGNALRWLADTTGGRYLQDVERPANPGPLFERLLVDLREMYTLGFRSTALDGRYHAEVRVKRLNVKLRARRLFAPSG
jgi:VWFA-related protein